jgi:hypothetical protein
MTARSRIRLVHVEFMPKVLESDTLYVSEAYSTAAHLCACGCGSKIRTPLGPTEWTVQVTRNGPTLRPSVGNWQHACRSHYLITDGDVVWADSWTADEIMEGRHREESRRQAYYESRVPPVRGPLALLCQRIVKWWIG